MLSKRQVFLENNSWKSGRENGRCEDTGELSYLCFKMRTSFQSMRCFGLDPVQFLELD